VTTVTDICNAAISHCGTRSKISSLTEGSPEANACASHFNMARDATLAEADWNFARRTVSLAQITCSVQRWGYEYVLPSDYIRLRRLNDTPLVMLPETFYEMAADVDSTGSYINVLFCNLSTVSAIYTAQVTDPNRWTAGFIDALTYSLAARVCFELTGKEDRVKALTQMWRSMMDDAAAQSANEGSALNRTVLPDGLIARGYSDGTQQIGQPVSPEGVPSWPWSTIP
jgi:hypothetical protein